MHRFKIENLPKKINNTFMKPDHKYPPKILFCNCSLKRHFLDSSKFAISYWGPKLWIEILSNEEKYRISSITSEKNKIKIAQYGKWTFIFLIHIFLN